LKELADFTKAAVASTVPAAEAAGGSNQPRFHLFPGATADGQVKQLKVLMAPTTAPYQGRVWEIHFTFP
jgi:hypothetical protein